MASNVCVAVIVATLLSTAVAECTVSGERLNEGQTKVDPGNKCTRYNCSEGEMVIIEDGCLYQDKCYEVYTQHQVDCMTFRCDKFTEGFLTVYVFDSLSARCMDGNKTCHTHGDKFPASIDGTSYKECTCLMEGNMVDISLCHN
ncbi:uncharacterized protein LOC131937958 [Physella acuta]|uniref:uncharacterized protein LOC131937958 n=1 Tax=Physella acuta TaxID=109671 RepID=UPI0027DDACA6|nr:uncharacterized protein LOC131937958 [Physella acuta]